MIFTLTLEEATAVVRKHLGVPADAKVVISRPKKLKVIKVYEALPLEQRKFRSVVDEVDRALAIGNRVGAVKAIRVFNEMALKTALTVVNNWSAVREKAIAAGRFLEPVFADKYDETPSKWV